MPKKKGVKKKKVKKKKKVSTGGIGDSLGGIEVTIAEKVDRFVNCQLKLINWILRVLCNIFTPKNTTNFLIFLKKN